MHIHWMYMQVKSSQSIWIFCVHFYDTQINWIDDSSMQSIYYIWSAWNIWIPTDLQKKSHFFGWFIINGTVSRFIGVVDVICVTSSPKSSLGITCMSHLFSEHALDSLSHVWASRFNVPVFFLATTKHTHFTASKVVCQNFLSIFFCLSQPFTLWVRFNWFNHSHINFLDVIRETFCNVVTH